MKGKQKLKQGKPIKGEARTEYGESKERCNLTLTPTAIALIDAEALRRGLSRSGLVEELIRELQPRPRFVRTCEEDCKIATRRKQSFCDRDT